MNLFNALLISFIALAPATTLADINPELEAKWGTDWPFSGITTFAHLNTEKCLIDQSVTYDIAVVGVPFDTAVSYRPGARFGPRSIRSASMRQSSLRGFNFRADVNPYQNWAKVIDCADIPVTPVDNQLALRQMTEGYSELLLRSTTNKNNLIPRIVAIGGDHSIALASLRALSKIYGPVTVIHFDAHLDTWAPNKYPSTWGEPANFTHGTMFWMARKEGLLANNSCIHAGLRTRLSGVDWSDYEDDSELGFARIGSDDIFTKGTDGIIKEILERVPSNAPVYISVDIDVIDPGMAPGTGTPEVGGWQTRELIRIIRGLEHLNLVGADLVEVAPAYDHAEITALAGAQIIYEEEAHFYKDPATLPTNDIAENPYYARNHRINYPKTSHFDQATIAGLLTLGSAANPRIADGNAGTQALTAVQQGEVKLTQALAESPKEIILGEILGSDGQPPVPPTYKKKQYKLLSFSEHGMYDHRYPVRTFK